MPANWKCQDCGEIKFGGAPGVCLSCGGDDFDVMVEGAEDECGDCGAKVQPDDETCPRCGAA